MFSASSWSVSRALQKDQTIMKFKAYLPILPIFSSNTNKLNSRKRSRNWRGPWNEPTAQLAEPSKHTCIAQSTNVRPCSTTSSFESNPRIFKQNRHILGFATHFHIENFTLSTHHTSSYPINTNFWQIPLWFFLVHSCSFSVALR